MTSPTLEPPPIQSTTRSQCTREGVTAKYYRRNSGQVESSPLYSAWFREEIIADQRFERRRRLLSLTKPSYGYSEMEIEFSDRNRANRQNFRPFLRGKRQVDCRICHTELTDWNLVTSPLGSPSPSSCYHLFHTSCYKYWQTKCNPALSTSLCPVCIRQNTPDTHPTIPTPDLQPALPIPLVLRGSLFSPASETSPEFPGEAEEKSSEVTEVVKVCEEKEDKEVVTPPVLET